MSKYMRFIAEFEVEVTDVTAAAAYVMNWSRGDDGELRMVEPYSDDETVRQAVGQAISNLLDEDGHRFGVEYMSSGVQARQVVDGMYERIELGEAPVRRDDGSLPERS